MFENTSPSRVESLCSLIVGLVMLAVVVWCFRVWQPEQSLADDPSQAMATMHDMAGKLGFVGHDYASGVDVENTVVVLQSDTVECDQWIAFEKDEFEHAGFRVLVYAPNTHREQSQMEFVVYQGGKKRQLKGYITVPMVKDLN